MELTVNGFVDGDVLANLLGNPNVGRCSLESLAPEQLLGPEQEALSGLGGVGERKSHSSKESKAA